MRAAEEVAAAAQLACLLEVSAPKRATSPRPALPRHPVRGLPGERGGHRTGARRGRQPAARRHDLGGGRGHRPLDPVQYEPRIILLLAPLARAAQRGTAALRDGVRDVLASTTVADAVEVYAAIRQARPGGLGSATSEDVATAPTVTLRDAMELAAERDSVAREYATGFATTFEIGAPALRAARSSGLGWSDATVETYLGILAALPDTHIARKLGRPRPRRSPAGPARSRRRAGSEPRRDGGRWRRWTRSSAARPTATTRAPPRI